MKQLHEAKMWTWTRPANQSTIQFKLWLVNFEHEEEEEEVTNPPRLWLCQNVSLSIFRFAIIICTAGVICFVVHVTDALEHFVEDGTCD